MITTPDAPPALLICLVVAIVAVIALAAIIGHRRRWRDPQRLFTWDQKKILLARAHGRCEHKHPLWFRCKTTTRLEADHITPWSKGGPTQLHNGQILCHRHNRAKTNKIPPPLYRWRLDHRRLRYPRTRLSR